jgi:hypothetical protein
MVAQPGAVSDDGSVHPSEPHLRDPHEVFEELRTLPAE